MVVDPSTNTAVGLLHLKYQAEGDTAVSLSIGDFISKTTGRGMGASVSFATPGESNGSRVYEPVELVPGKSVTVEITARNVWEAGESEADLYNNGNKIGTVKAVKYRVPFAIKLAVATSDLPEIAFQKGEEQRILLMNDDAMTYPATWDLTVDGQAFFGDQITLPPNGSASITIKPPDAWFSAGLSSTFKNEVRDGVLTIRFAPSYESDDPNLANRVFPVKAHLSYWSPGTQSVATALLTFLALLAGGVCSLVLSQWVPNRLRRLDLKEQFESLALKTRGLSGQLDSSLRVLVRVERMRLNRLLYSRWIMSPDMATVFTQCVRRLALLNRQVEILENIDSAYDRLLEVRLGPPSLLDRIEADLRKAASILNNSAFQDSELQAAQKLVADAVQRLSEISQPDLELAGKLVEKFEHLRREFDSTATPPPPVAMSVTRQRIEKAISGPFTFLKTANLTDPTQIRAMQYAEVDRDLCKLELVRDYVSTVDKTIDPTFREAIESHERSFLDALRHDNWRSLQSARSLIAQMHEGVFAADIEAALQAKEVTIETEPPVGRRNWPMRLSIKFTRSVLDTSTAKESFRCDWDFGQQGLKESGWTVYHYFPEVGTYTLTARFARSGEQAREIPPLERPIDVRPDGSAAPRDRFWTEIIQLSIALAVALFALMAGAREQLMRLDLIPALIAIFGIGFAADTIKNLLAPQPKG